MSDQQTQEVDERGVPLQNKIKEIERKLQEKYDKEIADTRRELQELKVSMETAEPATSTVPQTQQDVQAKLAEFVKDPDAWYDARRQAEERKRAQDEWGRQLPEAESWLKSQPGYTPEDDARVFQIIKDYALDTPYHQPMKRAQTAWKILSSEKKEKEFASRNDNQQREASVNRSTMEGAGKSTPKQPSVTRADLIKKLAAAEAKGDLDTAIQLTSMLEDVR